MPGSSSSEKKIDTTTNPWGPQAGALTSAFSNAGNAYNTASGAVAPTNFTAQMDPAAIAAFKQMVSQGGNLAIPNSMANTSTALQGAGTAGVQGSLSGLSGYDASRSNSADPTVAAAQKYVAGQDIPAQVRAAMQGATETARDVTMPGIEMNAAAGGNTNSSRTGIAEGLVQRGLAEQSANMSGSLSSQAFKDALTLAQTQQNNNNTANLGALTAQGTIGNTAANTGVNAGTASIAGQGALTSEAAAGGAGLTAAQQAILDNGQQQFASATQSPYAALSGLMGIIGTNNWGSSTNGTETTTKNPSAWDTISGLMSAGGSLAKGVSGFGGGK